MSAKSDASNVSRRRFLAAAGSVAVVSPFAAGKDSSVTQSSPPPAVSYLVTIDVTSGAISYAVSPPMDPHSMHVNNVDEIKWRVTSALPNPKHQIAILFINTTPFVDNSGHPTRAFQWSEKDDATGGFGGGTAKTKGTHEYSVAVFDGVTQKLYLDDPKIIVGGTLDAKAEVVEAESELNEVKEKLESVENLLRQAIEKL